MMIHRRQRGEHSIRQYGVKVMTYHGQVKGRGPPKLHEMGHSISNK